MMDESYEESVDEVRTSLNICQLTKKQTLVEIGSYMVVSRI